MENKIIKPHTKGQKHLGKTDWSKLRSDSPSPDIDEENPELAYKKVFKKVNKS